MGRPGKSEYCELCDEYHTPCPTKEQMAVRCENALQAREDLRWRWDHHKHDVPAEIAKYHEIRKCDVAPVH